MIVDFTNQIIAEKEKKTLNKPFRTPGGPKKFSVYVKNEKGNWKGKAKCKQICVGEPESVDKGVWDCDGNVCQIDGESGCRGRAVCKNGDRLKLNIN